MSDLCPLCGADPTAVEALRARVAEVERERDDARAWAKTSDELFEAASLDIAELQRERDARPDPRALLRALDAIRAASATGATPADLARMVEDVQMSMIRVPTGDGRLLGDEITKLRAERDELAATLANEHGDGPAPADGWQWVTTSALQGMWRRETKDNDQMVQRLMGRGWYWTDWAHPFHPDNVRPTARAAMRAAAGVKS